MMPMTTRISTKLKARRWEGPNGNEVFIHNSPSLKGQRQKEM